MNPLNILIIAVFLIAAFVWAYVKSTTPGDKIRLLFSVILALVYIGILNFTQGLWRHITLENPDTLYRFGIIPYFILIYLSASSVAISVMAWTKGGFGKLKKFTKMGIIDAFVGWMIAGLILGGIYGLFGNLIGGLIGGLIIAFIFGAIGGHIAEFKE